MRAKTKKILKWFGGITFAVVLLFGLAIYTLICPNIGEMSRYSYCYFMCISSEIRNVPLVDIQGNPAYYTSGLDMNHPTSSTSYNWVRYKSSSSIENIVTETKKYLSSIEYKDSVKSCYEGKSECSNCCWESNLKDSIVRITVTTFENDTSKFDVFIWLEYKNGETE